MTRKVALLGVPMDLGGGRRGVDMGPSAIRIAGIEESLRAFGLEFTDHGNVAVPEPESLVPQNTRARFLKEITDGCRRLRGAVTAALDEESLPLVVGGDHSIAVGSVAATSSWHHRRGERIGLLWFDAHADMNTPETTPSGNIHGMPLAVCLGHGPEPLIELGERRPMVDTERACLVGIRSVDEHERAVIRASGIKVFTMRDVDQLGMAAVMREALEIVSDGTAGFHLSFDLDGTDPTVAPGVGTPVRGGPTWREAHLVMEMAAESGRLLALDMTELNPILDDRNRTAEAAVELVLSALGKRTL